MRLHLISIAFVYFSSISSGTPILDQHIQPLAPFSLSPGNVNLETYWADKYRTQEGGDKLRLPVGQSNTDSHSPSALPPIVNNNNDGNSDKAVEEVLSRQRRDPQHHPYYHVPHHGHGHHGHGHHNPHHGHGHGHHHYSSLPIATYLHKPVFI